MKIISAPISVSDVFEETSQSIFLKQHFVRCYVYFAILLTVIQTNFVIAQSCGSGSVRITVNGSTLSPTQSVCANTVVRYGISGSPMSSPSWTISPFSAGTFSGGISYGTSVTVTWQTAGTLRMDYPDMQGNQCEQIYYSIMSVSMGSISGPETVCSGGDISLLLTGSQNAGAAIWQKCTTGCTTASNWSSLGNVTGAALSVKNLTTTTNFRTRLENSPCGSGTIYSGEKKVTVIVGTNIVVAINNPGPVCRNVATGLVFSLIEGSSNVGSSPTFEWLRNGSSGGNFQGPGDTNPDPKIYDPIDATYGFQVGQTVQLRVFSGNACDSPIPAYSNVVTITAPTETFPVLNNIVVSQNPICSGGSVTFTINSNSSGNISGAWSLGAGGYSYTGTTYTLNSDLVNGKTVSFSGNVTGSCGTVQSVSKTTSTLAVVQTRNPSVSLSNFNVCSDNAGPIVATPSDIGTFSVRYDWYVNNVLKTQNTTGQLSQSGINSGSQIRVVMTVINPVCSPATAEQTREFIKTTVTPISVSLSGPGILCGSGLTPAFIANVTNGGTNPTYVWYRNGNVVSDNNSSGKTYLPVYGLQNGETIKCMVTANGPCISGSPKMSDTFIVQVVEPLLPSVSIQHPGLVCAGDNVVFTATSPQTITSYSWKINSSATSSSQSTFSTTALQAGDAVYLTIGVNGSCLSNSTASANTLTTMVVRPAPIASIYPSGNLKICSTCSQRLEASTGDGYTFQWQKSGIPISGATSSSTNVAQPGIYTCKVSRNECTITSNALSLTMNSRPVANAGPDKILILPDHNVTLNGTGTDSDGVIISYKWTQVSGQRAWMQNADTRDVSLKDLQVGTYIFQLVVMDDLPEASFPDLVTVVVEGPPNNYNHIEVTSLLIKEKSESNLFRRIVNEDKTVSIEYFNGLGLPMQSVSVQASMKDKDVVTSVLYDAFARDYRHYLPVPVKGTNGFFKKQSNIIDATSGNYQGELAGFYSDARPFGETVFERTPMNQPSRVYGSGEAWKNSTTDRFTDLKELVNVHGAGSSGVEEKIIAWKISNGKPVRMAPKSGYIEPGGYYATGRLLIKSSTDEQGNTTREYLDMSGRTVLKKVQVAPLPSLSNYQHWAMTYYVYDEYGMLRFVFQPNLSDQLHQGNSNNPGTDQLNQLSFQYTYDSRRRLIQKRVPGAEPVFLVYDNFDRLILTQDGNQRNAGVNNYVWTYTKYDALNRPVMTGLHKQTTALSQPQLAETVKTNSAYTGNEAYNGTGTTHGYTNAIMPTTALTLLTANYYDNYNIRSNNLVNGYYDFISYDLAGQVTSPDRRVMGLLTGTKVSILESADFLWTVSYYDSAYHLVQKSMQHHRGGVDRVTNVYDFVRLKETKFIHSKGTFISEHRKFIYDKGGRLLETRHKFDDMSDFVVLNQNIYNDVGKLVRKKLHRKAVTGTAVSADPLVGKQGTLYGDTLLIDIYNNEDAFIYKTSIAFGPAFIVPPGKNVIIRRGLSEEDAILRNNELEAEIFAQEMKYQYNIRGWLNKINDPASSNDNLFNEELKYQSPSDKGGPAQFNGNVSEMVWRSAGLDKQSYAYTYDAMNRLLAGKYFNMGRPLLNDAYTEMISIPDKDNLTYDLNGNILRLTRNGKFGPDAFGNLDKLVYQYIKGDNVLTSINDIASRDYPIGFFDRAETSSEYFYDWNGNMKRDDNKGITAITYNALNLPKKVSRSSTEYIIYTYDATGRKLSQQVFGSSPRTTHYIGAYVYENITGVDQLKFVVHEEGRILRDNSPGARKRWEYQYFLKDHLGNVRVTFSERQTTTTTMATMEREPASLETSENSQFLNLKATRKIDWPLMNHTPGKRYSYLLRGVTGEVVGPARSMAVNAGDIVDLEVYAKYTNPGSGNSNVASLLPALVNAFGLTGNGAQPIDGQPAYNAFNSLFSPGAYVGRVEPYEDPVAPKAFLNYILFNENFGLVDFGFDQINTAARQDGQSAAIPHDQLSLHVQVQKKGYLYIFLSNENPTLVDVYFDDFRIDHHTNIEQVVDYYPFGLTFNVFNRSNDSENKIRFQGQEHVDALDLNWDSFKWRNYQPEIGRFFNIDPLAEKYVYNSTYAFSENKVVSHVELEGLEAIDAEGIARQDATKDRELRKSVEVIRQQQDRKIENGILQIGSTDITSGRALTKFDQAAVTGVDIGSTITGIYSLKNIPSLIKNGKNALSILKNIGKAEAAISERATVARNFYYDAGFSTERATAHMRGIDFTKSVERTTLEKGTIVQQWVGENGVGNYYTTLENGTAKNLGISYEGRTLQQFRIMEDVGVLKSSSVTLDGSAGGGTQFFSPTLKDKIVPIKN